MTQPKAETRTVYLPGKAGWYDFWTGRRYAGSSTVTVATPLDVLPLHVRAGAILPLELRVYRRADGAFTLYDDEGDGQGYRQGRRATVDLRWDEARKTLTIGARKGGYPGMPRERTFNIVWGRDQSGLGLAVTPPARTLRYTGQETVVVAP